jgi:hypothetical protein
VVVVVGHRVAMAGVVVELPLFEKKKLREIWITQTDHNLQFRWFRCSFDMSGGVGMTGAGAMAVLTLRTFCSNFM